MTRTLFLARHGETDWNAAGRWQGHTDVPLNARGREQAHTLGQTLASKGVGYIASSDLARAFETARIVARQVAARLGDPLPELRERRFGVFEGLTRAECAERHPEAWADWTAGLSSEGPPAGTPPGAETYEELQARAVAGVHRAIVDAGSEPLLLVTHGGTLRVLLHAFAGSAIGTVPNCAVYEVDLVGGRLGVPRLLASVP
jgi:probable phosphoglycerate mutase